MNDVVTACLFARGVEINKIKDRIKKKRRRRDLKVKKQNNKKLLLKGTKQTRTYEDCYSFDNRM